MEAAKDNLLLEREKKNQLAVGRALPDTLESRRANRQGADDSLAVRRLTAGPRLSIMLFCSLFYCKKGLRVRI